MLHILHDMNWLFSLFNLLRNFFLHLCEFKKKRFLRRYKQRIVQSLMIDYINSCCNTELFVQTKLWNAAKFKKSCMIQKYARVLKIAFQCKQMQIILTVLSSLSWPCSQFEKPCSSIGRNTDLNFPAIFQR